MTDLIDKEAAVILPCPFCGEIPKYGSNFIAECFGRAEVITWLGFTDCWKTSNE